VSEDGFSFREILVEVRDKVDALDSRFDHLENNVVLKTELEMWKKTQVNTRRWAITTILSLLVIGVMILGIVYNNPIGG